MKAGQLAPEYQDDSRDTHERKVRARRRSHPNSAVERGRRATSTSAAVAAIVSTNSPCHSRGRFPAPGLQAQCTHSQGLVADLPADLSRSGLRAHADRRRPSLHTEHVTLTDPLLRSTFALGPISEQGSAEGEAPDPRQDHRRHRRQRLGRRVGLQVEDNARTYAYIPPSSPFWRESTGLKADLRCTDYKDPSVQWSRRFARAFSTRHRTRSPI